MIYFLFILLDLWVSGLAFALRRTPLLYSGRLTSSLKFCSSNDVEWSLKRFPRDFIVIEDSCLSLLGTAMEVLPPSEEEVAQAEEAQRVEEAALKEFALEKFLPSNQLGVLMAMDSGGEGVEESIVLELKPALTKVQRTYFHKNVKNSFAQLESKTEITPGQPAPTDCTRILVLRKGTKSIAAQSDRDIRDSTSNGKKGRRQAVVQRWDSNKPEYLHFTLSKHLMTTDEALELLSKRTGLLATRFAVSGSKDKFAVTSQRVSAWRMEREVLDKYMKEMERRRRADLPVQVMVSDVVPATRPLTLGALQGNLFVLTLRPSHNVLEATGALSASLQSQWGSGGGQVPFLNLFGPQRFGSLLGVNVEVGKALLQEDYRKAVLLLLLCPSTNVEVRLPGSLDLLTLSAWLEAPPKGGSHAFWSSLQDHWAEYTGRMIRTLDDLEEKGIVSERARDQLVDRYYFLSLLLRGDRAVLSSRSFARAFPFSQRRLVENVAEQLRKEAKRLEAKGSEGGERLEPHRIDFKKAFSQALPRNLKLLFVNALQSHLFNAQCEEVYRRLQGQGQGQGQGQ